MKTIKNILVPTDFSATAHNAFEYAKMLGEIFDAQITVVHVQPYLLPASEIAIPIYGGDMETRVKETMDEFIADKSDSDVMVQTRLTTKILKGETLSHLVQLSRSKKYDLIVMGMTGLQDFVDKIIGTTSLDVSNQSACPVLLVPRDTHWQRVDRLLFAADRSTATAKTVRACLDWAESLSSKLFFVHVDEDPKGDYKLSETIWEELFHRSDPSVAFEMKTINSADTVGELTKYADKKAIDWFIFVSKHRNFWQNIIHRSISQNVAMTTTKPVLVMHLDD
jgi:nucleotide-binding universal stress UspA family protein